MENKEVNERKVNELHQEAVEMWGGIREVTQEKYREEVKEFISYVIEEQDLEPIHVNLILKHEEEIRMYDKITNPEETGNTSQLYHKYRKLIENLRQLHKRRKIEGKNLEKLMREASMINY